MSEHIERETVLFYKSFYDAIKCIPDKDVQADALMAIISYGLTGEPPDCDGLAKAIFCMAKPQIDANRKRFENGAKGGRSKAKSNQTETKAEPKPNQTETKAEAKEKGERRKEKGDIEKINKKESHFVPPTAQEVKEYCRVQELTVDADAFIDFYASKGWMVGKNKMKDWKAACRNWSRSNRTSSKSSNSFRNFEQRDLDFDDLEAQLDRQMAGGSA